MVIYKILNKTNVEYDAELITKMDLLYDGGYEIMDHADLFLTKLSIESQKSYNERLKCAAYMPYLSQFVDHFSSSLFSDDLMVREAADADNDDSLGGTSGDENFYKLFASNCDGLGNSLHNFMKDTFTESLYCYYSYVGVDFSMLDDNEDKPQTLLEEEARGLNKAYLYDIDPMTVIDWKKDDASQKFEWIKIKNEICVQDDPLGEPMKQVQFKIWTMRNGVAHWQLYQSKPIPLNKEFRPSDDVPLVAEGDTSFLEIPIFHLCIPYGLHLGAKLGPVCEEYFQRRSFLVSNMNKTCIAIPVIKLGPEINAPGGALPSDVQSNPNRAQGMRMQLSNQGYTVLGSEDDLEIKEANGHSHALVDKQLIDLRDQMHQVVNQMAQSASTKKGSKLQSAASKVEDRHSTEILLTAYARVVKDFVKEIFQCIAAARGEAIVWDIHGLSTFVEEDRQTIITEVQAIAGQQSILQMLPSETFHKKYLLRLAMALTGTTSPEEEAQIQEELEKAVENKEHIELGLDKGPQATTGDTPRTETAEMADPAHDEFIGDAMGPGGQPLLPDGAHLQTGEHVDGQVVFDQLAQDYQEKDIEFVKHIPWIGPVEVPLSSIDFSNKDNWQAAQPEDQEHVDKFADKMANENFTKPIILVNNPSNDNKMMVVDGHHRALAAAQNDQPVPAYVGQVGTNKGPWDKLHSKQVGSKQMSSQQVESNQVNETSVQKEVSTQVAKSEKAKGGKTK